MVEGKANRYVQKYGLHLLPQIYEYYNPMSYEVAAAKEKSLAEELRAEGVMQYGGIDGQSCPRW